MSAACLSVKNGKLVNFSKATKLINLSFSWQLMDVRVVDAKLESVETELVVVGMFVPAQMTAELKESEKNCMVRLRTC